MRERRLGLRLELGNDPLRQHLAKLDSPLVERIDSPDDALREDAVLVERDERAERSRCQPLHEDRAGRPVALEDTMGNQPVGRALGLDLLGGLAERERLGLREDIGQQHVVMTAERIQASGRRR